MSRVGWRRLWIITLIALWGLSKSYGQEGKLVYTVGADEEVRILDLADGTTSILQPFDPASNSSLRSLSNASWSPDGEWILFTGQPGFFSNQVWVMRPNGTNLRRVTDGAGDLTWPGWSPDGSRIVYHQIYGNVYIIDFDGSGKTKLPIRLAHIRWSPCGSKIAGVTWALAGRDGDQYVSDVYVYDLESGVLRQLTTHETGRAHIHLDWSPDGTQLIVELIDGDNHDIVVMNAMDGSGVVNLTPDWPDSNERLPSWTPDGRHILFISDRDGTWDIWAMEPDGSGRTQLTATGAVDEVGPVSMLLPSFRIVRRDEWTWAVLMTSSFPTKGGQAGIGFDPSVLRVVGVQPGAGLAASPDPIFAVNLSPQNACGGSAQDAGCTVAWVVSQSGATVLPAGKDLEVALLSVHPAAGAAVGDCSSLRFQDCFGPPEGLIANKVVDLDDVSLSTQTHDAEVCVESVLFRRGDANADGARDIADPIAILTYLFLGGKRLGCLDAADTTDDGELDLGDAIRLLVWQFGDSPPPPDPFDGCGVDPTADPLGCTAHAPCSGGSGGE